MSACQAIYLSWAEARQTAVRVRLFSWLPHCVLLRCCAITVNTLLQIQFVLTVCLWYGFFCVSGVVFFCVSLVWFLYYSNFPFLCFILSWQRDLCAPTTQELSQWQESSMSDGSMDRSQAKRSTNPLHCGQMGQSKARESKPRKMLV